MEYKASKHESRWVTGFLEGGCSSQAYAIGHLFAESRFTVDKKRSTFMPIGWWWTTCWVVVSAPEVTFLNLTS